MLIAEVRLSTMLTPTRLVDVTIMLKLLMWNRVLDILGKGQIETCVKSKAIIYTHRM